MVVEGDVFGCDGLGGIEYGCKVDGDVDEFYEGWVVLSCYVCIELCWFSEVGVGRRRLVNWMMLEDFLCVDVLYVLKWVIFVD